MESEMMKDYACRACWKENRKPRGIVKLLTSNSWKDEATNDAIP
jgi:hypothetical protein